MASRHSGGTRRQEIAHAALAVIAEEGLGRFTTAAIAARVGVTEGALFRHFESKEAIVLAGMDEVERILFEGFPAEHPDPITRLGAFFHQRIGVVRKHPVIARIVLSQSLEYAAGREGATRVAQWKRRTVDFIRRCLAEAESAGILRSGLPVRHVTLLVQGAFMAAALGPTADADPSQAWSTLEMLLRAPTGEGKKLRRKRT